ncbi:MAG TPA: hypothetical protein PLL21_05740 [Sedimentibacter sp.]|nr:hypothetical protein [Sedimentibacter sp.]
MLILNIAGKKYNYRSKQSEITLAVGKEIEETLKEYSCDCNPEFQRWALAILCGCSYDEAALVQDEQIALLIGIHPFFNNNILIHHQNFIKIKHKLYKYFDFKKPMTVEQYGNLDFMAMNEDFDELYLSLYQPVKWYQLKYWFRYLITKNHKSLNEINYFKYKLALHWYFYHKQELLKKYNLSVEDDGIPEEDKPDPYVLTDLEKYGLYHVLMELVEDDYDKQERWLKREIGELLKYLKYMNKKTLIKNQQLKQVNK